MKREFQRLLKEKGRKALPNVLLAAAECAPLAKTGGLADVVGTLPKSLAALGIDARVVMPYHRVIKDHYADDVSHLFSFSVDLGWRSQYVGVEKLVCGDVTVYLIDNEFYFGDKIYRGGFAEGEQFAFFTRAVLEALPMLDFSPDILHCNDWQTAMLPMLIKTHYGKTGLDSIKTLLTIHNIAFQGKFDFAFFSDLFGVPDRYYTPEFIELNGSASFLKAGCVFADRLSTVSPSYAGEICGSDYGEGLEGILSARRHELSGILNGIDSIVFNPRTDPLIPRKYDRGRLNAKRACKDALLSDMGLDPAPEAPLIAMVSRMTAQKGFDLVMRVLDELMAYDIRFVLLGTGDRKYEDFMRGAEARHRGRLCTYIGYDEALSHRVYAGADMFLMPSLFEPCGLSQMIAMRYGALPIVRETGGLRDTVSPYNRFTGEGNGFSFSNFNAHEMKDAVIRAMDVYQNEPKAWLNLVRNAMSQDFGFARSAEEYTRLYIDML
ncbi:MAG TPA: glycogen synthase GlgA [Clostridiales bacterium]|nr:glycogen synthase GlgA [Clostridiales bacterium]